MKREIFLKYLREFEDAVVCQGVLHGLLGKKELACTRAGKLTKTFFGTMMGNVLASDDFLAVDYYGLLKKSSGFIDALNNRDGGAQVRMVEATVVHFPSIKIEHIAALAPNLVQSFPAFKQEVLRLRGFGKKRNGNV